MSKKYVIANWKMNPLYRSEAVELGREAYRIAEQSKNVEVVVCPPYLYLTAVRDAVPDLPVASQDVARFESGAFTGQVSPIQLKNMGINYILLGHSEAREYLRETDEEIGQKLKMCLSNSITPIVCVGAGLGPEDSESRIRSVVRHQFETAVHGAAIETLICAYEPTWAISASHPAKMPDAKHVAEMIVFIRSLVDEEHINNAVLLYGGSINSGNAEKFADVADGFLVGSASLDAHEFSEIVKMVNS